MPGLRLLTTASLKKLLLGCTAAAVCITAGWFIYSDIFDDDETAAASNAVYEIPRQIRYSFTILNTTSRLIENGVFRTWAPVRQTPSQLCQGIHASDPFRILTDDFGHQILHFNLEKIPPYGSRVISVTADLLMSRRPNRTNSGDLKRWLDPEKYIESSHPDLKQKAGELKADTRSQTAENICKWVNGHVRYCGYLKQDRGALYAFSQKKGDCTEFMYLFAALCRAGSIPARAIGGYIAPQNAILKPAGFHNWAEFYDDGRWHPADPQNNLFMKNGQNFIVMRIFAGPADRPPGRFHRFQVEGHGLKAKMNS